MSEDLVERLRGAWPAGGILHEAAQEIMLLRREKTLLFKQRESFVDRNIALRAENEKLKNLVKLQDKEAAAECAELRGQLASLKYQGQDK